MVSCVVNDGPRRVPEQTRERVLRAIEELGYRPDGCARALRPARSRLLGLVVPDNLFFAEPSRVIEDEAFSRGYLLLPGNSTEDDDRQAACTAVFAESDEQATGVLHAAVERGALGASGPGRRVVRR